MARASADILARRSRSASARRAAPGHANDFLWKRIADDLRRKLRSGAIAPGARLPSLNDLAVAWSANRLTVMKAIDELREAGLVVSVQAQGNFAARRDRACFGADGERAVTVGLLSRVLNPAGFGHYHQEMIAGLYDGLKPIHANLLVMAAGEERPSVLPGLVRRAGADAMIYLGDFEPPLLARMLREGPPAAVLDFDAGDLPVDGVRVDNPEIGRLAVRHLLSLGVAPDGIAILEGNPADLSSRRRLAGAEEAIAEAGGDPAKTRVETGWFTRDGGRDAARRLFTAPGGVRPPRALYCLNDEMAAGALEALRELGLGVPGDVRIVGTDDSVWARSSTPPLTTIAIDARLMGSIAIRLLLKRLAAPSAPFVREVLAPSKIVRQS